MAMTWRSARDLQRRQQQMRAALDEALAGLTEQAADELAVADGRSVREVLAHLVLTEEAVLDDLRLMLAVDHPELPSIRRLDDPAALREVAARAGTVPGLLDELAAACGATLALIEALDEEQELRSGHSPELGNLLVGAHAALNVSYHYLGHIDELHGLRRQLSPLA
jgi:hypothetical protein